MKAKTVNESISFERGKDPKTSMGIGAWKDGYRINDLGEYDLTGRDYNRVDFSSGKWNFGRKELDFNNIPQTRINSDMDKEISGLPRVTFKNYYEKDGIPGMFGDWDLDEFPLGKIPFIANSLEDRERFFIIRPDGYDYPRYITELV